MLCKCQDTRVEPQNNVTHCIQIHTQTHMCESCHIALKNRFSSHEIPVHQEGSRKSCGMCFLLGVQVAKPNSQKCTRAEVRELAFKLPVVHSQDSQA